MTVLERLAARSVTQVTERSAEIGDCLVWTGAMTGRGYGNITVDGRATGVHRAAWIARHGQPSPETPDVLHRCDNRPCWREGHLFLGTDADNIADMIAKGRHRPGRSNALKTHCLRDHEYTPENTCTDRHGKRSCRACRQIAWREWHQRQSTPGLSRAG